LAYNYNILLFNLTGDALFWYTDKKKWIYNFFIQPAFLSGVLIYDDEQSPFIDCIASHYYEWRSIELALKTKLPIII
jgi:hypothetical protein